MATVDLGNIQRTIARLAANAPAQSDGPDSLDEKLAQLRQKQLRAREQILGPLIGRLGADAASITRELGANGRSTADAVRRLRRPSAASVAAGKARFALTSEQLRANIGILNGTIVQPGPETVVVLPQPAAILATPRISTRCSTPTYHRTTAVRDS